MDYWHSERGRASISASTAIEVGNDRSSLRCKVAVEHFVGEISHGSAHRHSQALQGTNKQTKCKKFRFIQGMKAQSNGIE
jgi:hypothetical protein